MEIPLEHNRFKEVYRWFTGKLYTTGVLQKTGVLQQLRVIDLARLERYQRLNNHILSGATYYAHQSFAVTVSKTFRKKFQLDGGLIGPGNSVPVEMLVFDQI